MERTNPLWKYEKHLFICFVLITALPVLLNTYFPTLDGPAHLHNGNLLKQYWFKDGTNIADFFHFNKSLSSNFIDHIWFAITGLFLPTFLVEKSILLFYLTGLPFAFRYLVKSISENQNSAVVSSYLIFPFLFTFPFRIGFFNFCIGMPLLFWTIGLWIRNREIAGLKKMTVLTLMATLVYLSHIFNFILLGIILFFYELQYIINSGTTKGLKEKVLKPAIILLPGIILTAIFYFTNSTFKHAAPVYQPKEKLVKTILDVSPVISLNYEKEIIFARVIGGVLCLLILLTGYNYFRNRKKENKPFRPRWIFSTICVLALFFIFPDWVVSGGLISIRWALFFFLILIVLIASKELAPKLLVIPISILMINHVFFIKYHYEETKILSQDAQILVEAEKHMEEKTVLLPLNYSKNWLQVFHANYLATQKNIINLDNYEPTQPHFPLIFKEGEIVFDLMPKYGNRNPPCINIDNYEQKTKHRIDYLTRFCFNGDLSDSCSSLVDKEIQQRFELIHESENKRIQLFKRKPNT